MEKIKISLLIAGLLLVNLTMAQNSKKNRPDDIYYTPPGNSVFSKQAAEASAQYSDMEWLRANLAKYHSQRQITFACGVVAAGFAIGSGFVKDETARTALLGTSGVLGVCGVASYFKAETYLKKASLPPPN